MTLNDPGAPPGAPENKTFNRKWWILIVAVVVAVAAVVGGIFWYLAHSKAKAFDEAYDNLGATLVAAETAQTQIDQSLADAFASQNLDGDPLAAALAAAAGTSSDSQSLEAPQSAQPDTSEEVPSLDSELLDQALQAKVALDEAQDEAQILYDSITEDTPKTPETTDQMNALDAQLSDASGQALEVASELSTNVDAAILEFAITQYDAAKTALISVIEAAEQTLQDSGGEVSDEATRTTLATNIDEAKALLAAQPASAGEAQSGAQSSGDEAVWDADEYDEAAQQMREAAEKLASSTTQVKNSVAAKAEADRIAAEEAAAAERAAAERAAQAARPSRSGSSGGSTGSGSSSPSRPSGGSSGGSSSSGGPSGDKKYTFDDAPTGESHHCWVGTHDGGGYWEPGCE